MNIRIGLIVVWAIVLLLSSCGSREENELRSSLNKAGRNRTELESVLSHYSKDSDSRKLEAARFLIRNMQYHYTRTSPEIVRYYEQMDSISRLTPTRWSVSAEQDSVAVNIQHIRLEPAQKMRYLRFVAGSDRCGGEVAEFGVYDIQGERLFVFILLCLHWGSKYYTYKFV